MPPLALSIPLGVNKDHSRMHDTGAFGRIASDARRFALEEGRSLSPVLLARLLFATPGFQFVFSRRIQELLSRVPLLGGVLSRTVWWLTSTVFRCDIAPNCKIGAALFVPHPYGIVLDACVLGNNVTLLQNVGLSRAQGSGGPLIGDDVYLGAGCVIAGPFTVGRAAVIGANAVIVCDVPDGETAVGNPARIVERRPSLTAAPSTGGTE